MHISTVLIFWSLFSFVRNSVVLAVYLLFSVACFFTLHEHYDEGYIFVDNKSKRTTRSSINKYLYSLCEDAGIKMKKSSHKIRKTYLSSLFDTGINVDRIIEIAGHEDERTSLNNYCFDTKTDKEFEKM